MLHYALIFFVIAMLALLFSFSGLAAGVLSLVHLIGLLFILFAVGGLIVGLLRGH